MPGTYRYHWKSIDVSSWMAQTKTSKLLEWKSFLVKNWKIANRLATFDWFAPKHSLSSRNDDNPNYRTDELGSSLECVRAQCFRCSMLFSIENEQWTMKTANRMLFLMDTLPILCRWNYPHLENVNNIVICSVNFLYHLPTHLFLTSSGVMLAAAWHTLMVHANKAKYKMEMIIFTTVWTIRSLYNDTLIRNYSCGLFSNGIRWKFLITIH